MADLVYKGYSYEVITRPWKSGKNRYEVVRWKTGYRNLWDRISYEKFLELKKEKEDSKKVKEERVAAEDLGKALDLLKEGSSGSPTAPLSVMQSSVRSEMGKLYYELLEYLGQDNFEITFNQSSIVIKPKGEYVPGFEYTPYITSLTKSMEDAGLNLRPLPRVVIGKQPLEESSNFFRKTAEYDPEKKQITLYTEGRHPKDVVRSFAHEMIHHSQMVEGRLGNISTSNVNEDQGLEKLEEEAYTKSNILFRKWEDSQKNKK